MISCGLCSTVRSGESTLNWTCAKKRRKEEVKAKDKVKRVKRSG